MFNILAKTQPDNGGQPGKTPEKLFSTTQVNSTRRASAWLEDRLRRGRKERFTEEADLTPELAELLLSRNPGNRKLKRRKVDALVADIRSGHWSVNGENIIISVEGFLNNGQHRCTSVIEAGRPIRTNFSFGYPYESRLTVDQGSVKTAGDYLGMAGHKDANVAATAAGFLAQYQMLGRLNKDPGITKAAIRETYEKHPGIDDSIRVLPRQRRGIAGSVSLLAFCHYVFAQSNKEKADEFIQRLCLGDGLRRNDPIYVLREHLLRTRGLGRAPEKAELIFRTFVAWKAGKTAKTLPHTDGTLPKIGG